MPRKSKAELKRERDNEIVQWITVVILCALVVLALMRSGIVGIFLYQFQRYLIGNMFWLIVGIVIVWLLTIIIMNHHHHGRMNKNPVAIILIILGILLLSTHLEADPSLKGMDILFHYINRPYSFLVVEEGASAGGGIVGALLCALISLLFGRTGVIVVAIVFFVIAALLMVSLDVYKRAFQVIYDFFRFPEEDEEEEYVPELDEFEDYEQPNLWTMISNHREMRRMRNITVDEEDEVEEDTTTILSEEKNLPTRARLVNQAGVGPEEIVIPVFMPGTTISDAQDERKSIFINYQDLLMDDVDDEDEYYDSYEDEEVDYEEDYEEEEEEIFEEEEVDELEDTVDLEQIQFEELKEETQEVVEEKPKKKQTKKKQQGFKNYKKPNVYRVLDEKPVYNADTVNKQAAKEKGELLIQILKNFDIEAELVDTHIGPSVTQFEIKPDPNVKVSKILGLTDNIKMQLAAKDIRIEAPIPGRPAVGIEVPNPESTPVRMREIINQIPEKDKNAPLLFVVGKDLLGNPVTCRLDKMPHLLIAGATGSGKSVCMNSIITSLLLRTKPDDVKMLLIDPKKVEFVPYQNIPHLIGPVISDATKASNALKVIVRIMDERYDAFSKAGVRNITVYNEMVKKQGGKPNPDGSPAPKPMPYIVVIIDELADLMVVAGKEVEASIQRITQLARAAGIHLIVATQRPSTDVITGIIKANIPSRIAFAVSSGIDSRTILDHVGAERLLGNGDMLYMPIGQNAAQRVQGVFVSDGEVQNITDFVSKQATPMYDDSFLMLEGVNDGSGVGGVASVEEDPLFQEVKDYVIEAQKASTSLLQRRFGIGYNRAARMIDALEASGVIGPAQGSKPREVYLKKED